MTAYRLLGAAIAPVAAALLLAGCSRATDPSSPSLCLSPAPLTLSAEPAGTRYIVAYRDGVDPTKETARLAARYRFTPIHVYTAVLDGFDAELSPVALAALRCEPSVKEIEQDSLVHLD